MAITSLYTLGLRQVINYTMTFTIYRELLNSNGKQMLTIAEQVNSLGQSVQLIGVPGIFEPTVNTDQFAGMVGLVKDSNLMTLNPFFLPATIDIRDNDRVFVTSPVYELPWFAVNGEPKTRYNQGLRTPNYCKVLLDPIPQPLNVI